MRSKIADTVQTSTVGYLPYFCQQIAHRAIHGETGLKKQLCPLFLTEPLLLTQRKNETRSKIADTAQTFLFGYVSYFPQQIAHRATHGETRLKNPLR